MTERTDTSPTPPLRRSRSDRVLAGVAGGIARRIDLPVWVIRVAFVVLAVFGGFGIALYLTGWLLIPEEDSDEPIVKGAFDRVHGAAGWIGVALIALAALVIIDSVGFLRGDLTLAAILVVIGVLLYRGDLGRRPGGDEPTGETPPPGDEPGVAPERDDEPGGPETIEPPAGAAAPAVAVPPPPPPPPPAPPRPRSPLGRVTLALALLAIGGMWLADTAMASFDPTPRHYFGATIAVLGLGLLVGSWIGRARGLIVLGILLTPVLLVTPVLEGGLPGSFGERVYAPTTTGELAARYELGAGRLLLDLRDLRLDGGEDEVEVYLGFGDLDIRLPDDVRVEVHARIGAGELRIGDQVRSGLGREIEATLPGADGVLRIDIEMNVGDADVTRGGVGADRALGDVVDRRFVIHDPEDLDSRYDFVTGTVVFDLRDLELTGPTDLTIDLGTGDLRVIVPARAAVDIDASVGAGTLDIFGDVRSGVGIDGSFGASGTTPELRLDLELGSGDLIVEEG